MPPVDRRPPFPTFMVNPKPPRPPRSVREVLRTGRIPDDLVKTLLERFRVKREDGGYLSKEKYSGRGVHSFLAQLASRVDPVPGFEQVALFQVDPDITAHLLHSLFSVPSGLYLMARWILSYCGKMLSKGLPPVADLPVGTFRVRRSVRAVLRADHVNHLEGVTPYMWQDTTCKRVGKVAKVGCDLAC